MIKELRHAVVHRTNGQVAQVRLVAIRNSDGVQYRVYVGRIHLTTHGRLALAVVEWDRVMEALDKDVELPELEA